MPTLIGSPSTVGAYSGWAQATGNIVEDMFGKRGFVEDVWYNKLLLLSIVFY